ncbi:hypothetical protein [Dyadobacter bucti]|uniref:hypothetical protein n=1 Tax=Dyadobacter bucti TaxID=2572203 RepID=UPI00110918F4|nr:hypothetical protein [Dyadobacter bucti]
MEEQPFDPREAEQKELDLLNSRGMFFEVPKRWTGSLSKTKLRKFHIKSPPLGVMDRLSDEYIKLDLDEELLEKDPYLKEAKNLTKKHTKRCARIVAIAVLGNSPLFRFIFPFLADYFYWRINSRMLFKLTLIILQMSYYGDFINSIRYLSAARRTTTPQMPETQLMEDLNIED